MGRRDGGGGVRQRLKIHAGPDFLKNLLTMGDILSGSALMFWSVSSRSNSAISVSP